MADMLEILQQFLCYGNSSCNNMFAEYAYKPIEGLFYLVFFPILFILLFIFILSNKVMENKGMRMLLSLAVFAFIILQGYYGIFIIIGKSWIFGLFILGFLFMLMRTLKGKPQAGGGHARDAGAFESLGGAIGKRLKSSVSGQEKRLIKEIEMALEEVETIKHVAADDPGAWRMATSVIERLHALRAKLEEMMSVSGFALGDFNKWDRRIQEAIKSLQHLQSSGASHKRGD